jgi:cobalamin biosynthesis Co2+ chelatase CbiK
VETALQGIGEWEEVQELFAEHAIEASESVRHTDEQSI